jgi:hypothetical protein
VKWKIFLKIFPVPMEKLYKNKLKYVLEINEGYKTTKTYSEIMTGK